MESNINIQVMELDPSKVYSIVAEVGDMTKSEVIDYLTKIKSICEERDIKAIYTAASYGVPTLTINEILPAVKEWPKGE